MHVSAREVRQHLGEILDLVSNGEHAVVTRRGTPVARIVAHADEEDSGPLPVGLAARAGALARIDGFGEAVATVVSLRSLARDREPPEMG